MTTEPVVRHPNDLQADEWDDTTRGAVRFANEFSGDQTPTDSMTSGWAEIPVGRTFAAHQHSPAEIYHVLEGRGVVVLDGTEMEVEAGAAVFIPSRTRHELRNTGDVPLRLWYVLSTDSFEDVAYEFPGQDPTDPSAA